MPLADTSNMRGRLTAGWLAFAAFAVVVVLAGYATLLVAFFGGPHDALGVVAYVGGAMGSTGAFFAARRAMRGRLIRAAATTMALLVAGVWVIEVPSFLTASGWQF